jgi:hypothetical protein
VWYLENNGVGDQALGPIELNGRIYSTRSSDDWISIDEVGLVVEISGKDWLDARSVTVEIDGQPRTFPVERRTWRPFEDSLHEEYYFRIDDMFLETLILGVAGELTLTGSQGTEVRASISKRCMDALQVFWWHYLADPRLPARPTTKESDRH